MVTVLILLTLPEPIRNQYREANMACFLNHFGGTINVVAH
jgi:hypothetical protein